MNSFKEWLSDYLRYFVLLLALLLAFGAIFLGVKLYQIAQPAQGDPNSVTIIAGTENTSETETSPQEQTDTTTEKQTEASTEKHTELATEKETEKETETEQKKEESAGTGPKETLTEKESVTERSQNGGSQTGTQGASQGGSQTGTQGASQGGSQTGTQGASQGSSQTGSQGASQGSSRTGTQPGSSAAGETAATQETEPLIVINPPETDPPQTDPPQTEPPEPVYLTMTGACYIRSYADYGDNIIGEYPAGTVVEFLEDVGGWYKVQVDGMVGYMGARFFQ